MAPALVAMLAAGCGSYDLQFEQACQRQGIERGDPRFETCVTERRTDWERRLSRSFPSRGGGP